MRPRILTSVVDLVHLLQQLITASIFFLQLSCEPHRIAQRYLQKTRYV